MSDGLDWPARIRAALAQATAEPDEDVVAELAEHAAAAYSDALARGATLDEAASRVMQDIEQWRIEAADLKRKRDRVAQVEPPPVDRSSWGAGLVHDLRYALRLQRRQLKFAALVIGLTALGIGATAALFSVTYDVLVKPLPWPNADRVLSLTETRGGNRSRVGAFTNVVYLAWQDDAKTVPEPVVVAQASSGSAASSSAASPEAFPAYQRGVRAAAAQGTESLRRYVYRTRMIYGFYYNEFAPKE